MAAAKAVARTTTLTIDTYVRHPGRRLPDLFNDGFGNLYPDRRDDILGSVKRPVDYDAVILENPCLRITILPALGGKIWSVYDKLHRAEAVHVPDCIKPGLIHQPGAWIPGGFEFNFPIGHHVDGMHPLETEIISDGPDLAAARISRTCRRNGLAMTVDVTLAAGEARFGLIVRLSNPTDVPQRWYQWTNVGVPLSNEWQFQCKARWYTTNIQDAEPFPVNRRGKNYSWLRERGHGDAFMIGCRENFVGYYDHGRHRGLMHVADWRDLRGKKYFTWGADPDFNSPTNYSDAGLDYVEIQTGPLETQAHFALMPPGDKRRYDSVWYPIAETGSVEWADEDLTLGIRDGKAVVQALVDCDVEIRIGRRRFRESLAAGQCKALGAKAAIGTKIEVLKNDRRVRAFTYPLKGRSEPDADKRLRRERIHRRRHRPRTGDGPVARLARARKAVLHNAHVRAVREFGKVLRAKPDWHAVRLELAHALWRTGDFPAASRQLRKLLKTRLADQARELLARYKDAETGFLAPAVARPAGKVRDLALAERYAGYGRYDAAAKLYRKLLRTDPKNPRVHYGLACYYARVKRDLRRAVASAERTLDLAGGDRDYLLEFAPLYIHAGRADLYVDRMAAAPPSVRKLTHIRKFLGKAQFEAGRFDAAFKTLTAAPIPIYEGETFPAATLIDTAVTLAARAVIDGKFEKAETLLDAVTPEELDRLYGFRRYMSLRPRRQYLAGLIAHGRGQADEARRIWGEQVDETLGRHRRSGNKLPYWSDWWSPPKPEVMYMRGLAAINLGDDARTRQVMKRLAVQGQQSAEYWFERSGPTLIWQALTAELEGDFHTARKLFEKAIAEGHDARLAKLHLEAVKANRRHLAP